MLRNTQPAFLTLTVTSCCVHPSCDRVCVMMFMMMTVNELRHGQNPINNNAMEEEKGMEDRWVAEENQKWWLRGFLLLDRRRRRQQGAMPESLTMSDSLSRSMAANYIMQIHSKIGRFVIVVPALSNGDWVQVRICTGSAQYPKEMCPKGRSSHINSIWNATTNCKSV